MARRRFALPLALLLCGCVEVTPEFVADAPPDPSKNAVQTNWQGGWDPLRTELSKELGSSTQLLHQGKQLSLYGVLVRDRLPEPTQNAAEVFVVVEGLGVLTTQTAIHALEPGTIAVLGPGARRDIRALGGELSGLLLRSDVTRHRASAAIADQVSTYQQVFPASLDPEGKENVEGVIGIVPGQISARALSIGTMIPRHMHAQHDEFLFLLRGWGTMGLGGFGESRNFVSYPLRERSLVFMDPLSMHSYRDEEGRTFALSIHGGPSPEDLTGDTVRSVTREPLKRHSLGHRNQLQKHE